jgi:hypothetical protein
MNIYKYRIENSFPLPLFYNDEIEFLFHLEFILVR